MSVADDIRYCHCIGGPLPVDDDHLGVHCLKCGHDIKHVTPRWSRRDRQVTELMEQRNR